MSKPMTVARYAKEHRGWFYGCLLLFALVAFFCLKAIYDMTVYGAKAPLYAFIAGMVGKKNPLRLFRNMLPAYMTALGTQSSAATIPVTLEQTIRNGVRPDLAGFVIPLCATIHLSGSTMKIVACSMAINKFCPIRRIYYDARDCYGGSTGCAGRCYYGSLGIVTVDVGIR